MTPQKQAGFLKPRLPLAVIAVAVAALAFAACMLASNRGAADEPTPDVGANPDVVPTPTVPPELYSDIPTDEEFARNLRELKRRQVESAPGNDDKNDRLGFKYTPPPSPTPSSTAEARFMAAPLGRALYFVSSDRVIFLPEGVEEIGSIVAISCYHENCPAPPITLLKKGEARVFLDAYGNVVPYFDTDDPDAFPFLKEYDE